MFSDSDLQRYKEQHKDCHKEVGIRCEVCDLFARLEASERIHEIPHRCNKCGVLRRITGKFVEAWHKAAVKL